MELISAAVLLLFIMDPFGNIPVFHSVLKNVPLSRRPRVIARELVFAYLVLALVLLAGEGILTYLGLSQASLSIAGGVILFLIALGMVFPQHGLHPETQPAEEEPFIVPLAVPMVAGPSAIALLLVLVSRYPDRRLEWLTAMSAAWAVTALILVLSTRIYQHLGPRGVRAVERLIGMVLIMMAVDMFLDGLAGYLGLPGGAGA